MRFLPLATLVVPASSQCASSIGLRFQKFDTPDLTLPEVENLYPINARLQNQLAGSQAVSMRTFEDDMVRRNVPGGVNSWSFVVEEFFEGNPRFMPTHVGDPDPAASATFWTEMEEVIAAQQLRRAGSKTSAVFTPHELFDSMQTMDEGAQLVRADFPTEFPTLLVKRFLGQATLVDLGLVLDDNIFRQVECGRQDKPEFVNGGVALSGLISWAITQVSPVAFASKWYNGRLRPEEVAQMVTNGCLNTDVPAQLYDAILAMQLSTAVDFTAYDEGSPVHPAYPAMHSAASSISTWLEIVSVLTPEQRAEAQLLDFSIAYYRTFAGVHYDSDNRAGLQIGRSVLVRALPDHLAEIYGCTDASSDAIRTYVTAKIPNVPLNDWSTFDPPGWRKPVLQNVAEPEGNCASAIGLRFQKFEVTDLTLPETENLYPIDQSLQVQLSGSQAVSMRTFEDNMVRRNIPGGINSWGQVVEEFFEGNPRFMPTHVADPDPAANAQFWVEMEEVIAAQQMRRAGLLTSAVFTPHPLFGPAETMDEGAQRVRADFPTEFPTLLVQRFLGQATLVDLGLVLDDQIFRQSTCGRENKPEFVNGGVALSGLIAWAITQVSPVAFASKWYNGRLRPEEVAQMVTNGCLDRSVPTHLRAAINAFGLKQPTDFTAYDEGSPVHPSYPAMHSAASSISTWLEIVSELTPDQRAEAQLLDFSIAYYRTFAGVHYDSDNRAGLQIGRSVLVRALPGHLSEIYGCNAKSRRQILNYVTAKIPRAQLNDWATYDPPAWRTPQLQTVFTQ